MRAVLAAFAAFLFAGCSTTIDRPGADSSDGTGFQDCDTKAWADLAAGTPEATLDPLKVIYPKWQRCNVEKFVVAVDENGRVRPVYGPEKTDRDPSTRKFMQVSQALTNYAANLPEGVPVRILVFAHGGMIDHGQAIRDAERLAPYMIRDGYFPLFLVWNSDFESAYTNHLCCVSDGIDVAQAEREGLTFSSAWNAPTRILGDLGAGVFRAPEHFIGQVNRYRDTVLRRDGTDYYLSRDTDGTPVTNGHQNVTFPPFITDQALNDRSTTPRQKQLAYITLSPVRVVTTTFAEAGTSAWMNMVRRTRLSFRSPEMFGRLNLDDPLTLTGSARCSIAAEYEEALADGESLAEPGSFSMLFTWLDCQMRNYRRLNDREFEITFVGHSMGAIVGNELVREFPDLPYKRIVFMGAATSVRETGSGVFALMARNEEVEFYNLMLHPLAEARELPRIDYVPGGVVPQGSLLEWIDEMFERPRSREDRMIGKWLNVKASRLLFPADQSRVHLRVFPVQEELPPALKAAECDFTEDQVNRGVAKRCHPIGHADFNNFSFWRDAYLHGVAEPVAE